MLFIKKYSFAVEDEIQDAFNLWLKQNGMCYGYDVMRDVPNARFRVYTVWFALMNYRAITSLIDNKLKELREVK